MADRPIPGVREALLQRWPTSARASSVDPGETWVSLEPTFTSREVLANFAVVTAQEGGEDAWFEEPAMRSTQKEVALEICRAHGQHAAQAGEDGLFERTELRVGADAYGVERHEIDFCWRGQAHEPFNVRVTLDPEVIEYGTKPVPVAWLYEPAFVGFLQEMLWDVPARQGLVVAMAHGGGQFHLGAKTFLQGSLLADLVAWRVDHPELATWILGFANRDERAFAATAARRAACMDAIEAWWSGRIHPTATGTVTVGDVFSARPITPASAPRPDLADAQRGVRGGPQTEAQANFAFARWLCEKVQIVDTGYWQSINPRADGFKPAQVARYSECNFLRVQLKGEFDIKSGRLLDADAIPELATPIGVDVLARQASVEYRAQASRTSAHDYAEAVLLEVHHLQRLLARPRVSVRASLLQDQILRDAEATLRRLRPDDLDRLRKRARERNAELSEGRIKSDRIEPEALMWAAWKALPDGERAAVAREAITGFIAHVEEAAAFDPRPTVKADPMAPHRHRVHPLLWKALQAQRADLAPSDPVTRELQAWEKDAKVYLARRPVWSPTALRPPWYGAGR
jgi:hypothetical protein